MRKNRLNRKKKKNSKRKKSWIAIKAKVKEEAIKATPEICLLRCSNRSKRNMPRRTKVKYFADFMQSQMSSKFNQLFVPNQHIFE